MKAAVVSENSTIKIQTVSDPELGQNDILVKMAVNSW